MLNQTPARNIADHLLLRCAAAQADDLARAEFARLAQQELDWDYLFTTAEAHGMLPLLRKRLDEVHNAPPALTRAFIANATRNLALTGELMRILSMLESAGIEAVPFKGPALSEQVFGTVAMRQFCDIDILVRPKDVVAAKQALLARGYEPEFTLSPSREAEYIRSEHAFQFRKDSFILELHWSFGSRDQSFPVDVASVWTRLETRTLQGHRVRALSVEDLFLYLCMHGAKHSWERLEWVCSLAELGRMQPAPDWNRITSLARRTGALRGLHLGLLLAADVCALALPPEVAAAAASDREARRLAIQARANFFLPQPTHRVREFRRHRYYFDSRERLADRIRIVLFSFSRIPHPLARDWDLFRLPAGMAFLYYLLRPIRIFREYGLRLLQG